MSDKIRVLYDELGFREPHGGVSRYFTELVKHLPDDVEGCFSAVRSRNVYLTGQPYNVPWGEQDVYDFIKKYLHGRTFPGVSYLYAVLARLMPKRFPSMEYANRCAFKTEIKRGVFDVLHITAPHPVFNCWKSVVGKKPIVATVHDLIPELLHENRRVGAMRQRLIKEASHIIAVSENTKRDLVRLYGVDEKMITVVYHGYVAGDAIRLPFEKLSVKPLTRKYILFVGKRDNYKNFGFFITAVAPLLKSDFELSVFCTGTAFSEQENMLISRLGITRSVAQGFVPDEELSSVFANAGVFVYPSKYEGFGIPILDAFASSCPVVLSKSSCFPEVAGDAALYFNDGDIDGLRNAVENVIKEPGKRRELVERGRKMLARYSWEKCAKETSSVYMQVVSKWREMSRRS